VATYERDRPGPVEGFDPEGDGAAAAARWAYGHEFEHAVCAAGVRVADGGIETAVVNG
jgi:IMP cyclohydrolase